MCVVKRCTVAREELIIGNQIPTFPIFWDTIPLRYEIVFTIFNINSGKYINAGNYSYARLKGEATIDMPFLYLTKKAQLDIYFPVRSMFSRLHRIAIYKKATDKKITVRFMRVSRQIVRILKVTVENQAPIYPPNLHIKENEE